MITVSGSTPESYRTMMPMSSPTWITVKEAVEISGYHPDHLRRLLRAGTVKGTKIVTVWQVDEDSLRAYLSTGENSGDDRWGAHGAREKGFT